MLLIACREAGLVDVDTGGTIGNYAFSRKKWKPGHHMWEAVLRL